MIQWVDTTISYIDIHVHTAKYLGVNHLFQIRKISFIHNLPITAYLAVIHTPVCHDGGPNTFLHQNVFPSPLLLV